jgi:hypothetical protein
MGRNVDDWRAPIIALTASALQKRSIEVSPWDVMAHVSKAAAIVAVAGELEVDLILMPTHGDQGVVHMIVGSC